MHLFAFRVCHPSADPPMWFVMHYYYFRGCLANVQYKYRDIARFLQLIDEYDHCFGLAIVLPIPEQTCAKDRL